MGSIEKYTVSNSVIDKHFTPQSRSLYKFEGAKFHAVTLSSGPISILFYFFVLLFTLYVRIQGYTEGITRTVEFVFISLFSDLALA